MSENIANVCANESPPINNVTYECELELHHIGQHTAYDYDDDGREAIAKYVWN